MKEEEAEKKEEEAEIERFLQQQINEIGIYDDECAICTEKFQLREELTVYDCKHGFHTNCIEKGLEVQENKLKTECPTCRTNVVKFSNLKKVIIKAQ